MLISNAYNVKISAFFLSNARLHLSLELIDQVYNWGFYHLAMIYCVYYERWLDRVYDQEKKLWCNILVFLVDKSMTRPGSDLWFDGRDLQLYRTKYPEYVREISCIKYKINNYNNNAQCEIKNRKYRKIKRHLTIGLEEYNIQ